MPENWQLLVRVNLRSVSIKSFVSGNALDGDCFSYTSYLNDFSERPYSNVYHGSISTSASTPQECINYCKSYSTYVDQFTYAIIQSSTCRCGNAPPFIESSSCTYSCSGDSSKTCGGSGSSASFYTIPNQSEFLQKILKYTFYFRAVVWIWTQRCWKLCCQTYKNV